MNKLFAVGAAGALVLLGSAAIPANADPAYGQLCPAGDSGKIDVSGDQESVTVYAPEGQLITSYCVKAGPTAEIVVLDQPSAFVVITPSNGKDVSHYSVWYGDGGYES